LFFGTGRFLFYPAVCTGQKAARWAGGAETCPGPDGPGFSQAAAWGAAEGPHTAPRKQTAKKGGSPMGEPPFLLADD